MQWDEIKLQASPPLSLLPSVHSLLLLVSLLLSAALYSPAPPLSPRLASLSLPPPMSVFRPCIDLHSGQVKQIVGGTLDTPDLKTNFVSACVYPLHLLQVAGADSLLTRQTPSLLLRRPLPSEQAQRGSRNQTRSRQRRSGQGSPRSLARSVGVAPPL